MQTLKSVHIRCKLLPLQLPLHLELFFLELLFYPQFSLFPLALIVLLEPFFGDLRFPIQIFFRTDALF